jgi:hypothetical protein
MAAQRRCVRLDRGRKQPWRARIRMNGREVDLSRY